LEGKKIRKNYTVRDKSNRLAALERSHDRLQIRSGAHLSYFTPFSNGDQLTYWKEKKLFKIISFEINQIDLRHWKDRTIGYKLDRVHFCRISDRLKMASI